MSKIDIVRRCNICGEILQSEDKNAPGYIAAEVLASKPLDSLVSCDKCYEENIFHTSPSSSQVSKDFLTILDDARATNALIVYIVDLFSFESFFVDEINEKIKSLPILVLGNKRDLLPKSVSQEELKEYVAHRFRVSGLPIRENDVLLTSFSSGKSIDVIVKRIDEMRRAHDVYIIGAPLSGKSLFFNAFLRSYSNNTKRTITTRMYQGTNLRLMRIPLDSSSYLYDAPGAGGANSVLSYVDAVERNAFYPSSEVKGKNVLMEKGTSLLLGSLIRIDVLEAPGKIKGKAYFAPTVDIQKVPTKKAEERFLKRISLLESGYKPLPMNKLSLKDMDVFEVSIDETNPRDLGFAGIGWFSLEGAGTRLRVYLPKGAGLYTSRAKVRL